jgi:hypothetical protein
MGNFTVAPRSPHTQQLPYFRRSVAYNTLEIGTSGKVPLGTLPAGAIVTGMLVKVTTAFNAATTNVLTVGTSADDDAVIGAADVNELEADTTVTFGAVGYSVTEATPLFVKYTQTGTAATAGAATIILFFVPDNDR